MEHAVDQVSRMDNIVDSLDESIKLYITKLTRGSLDESEGKRAYRVKRGAGLWVARFSILQHGVKTN